MTTRKTLPLALLIEDWDIYPRHAVNNSHVNSLYEALAAGDTLPPPRIDTATHRIVDGFHRIRAYRKHLGDDASITVDLNSYPTELALLEDAVRLNAAHGAKLETQDLTRATILLRRLGATTDTIAATLSVTPSKLEKIAARIVIVQSGDHREEQPAKPSLWPTKTGETHVITGDQYRVHKSSSGWRHRQTIKQLRKELDNGLVTLNEPTITALKELRNAIDIALNRVTLPETLPETPTNAATHKE
jgi:hypothetical protein